MLNWRREDQSGPENSIPMASSKFGNSNSIAQRYQSRIVSDSVGNSFNLDSSSFIVSDVDNNEEEQKEEILIDDSEPEASQEMGSNDRFKGNLPSYRSHFSIEEYLYGLPMKVKFKTMELH